MPRGSSCSSAARRCSARRPSSAACSSGWGVPAAEALSIGDETRDVDAAREVGMRAGSVLWGYASEGSADRAQPPMRCSRAPEDILDYVAAHR
ncbi:MAG: HAD hydrolase-like protein [Sphingomonas sp.]